MMTFVPENFFYLFSTDWNFYDVVIDTPVFKNVAVWKYIYIYNIYIFSCLIKRDTYVYIGLLLLGWVIAASIMHAH